MQVREILIPTDFSSSSRKAMGYALSLAEQVGAAATLLHAYQIPALILPDGSTFVAPPQDMMKLNEDIDRHLNELLTEARQWKVEVKIDTVIGTAAHEIVRYAVERRFDLIVMGTHGRTGLKHLLLGSVAEHVVRTSAVPVLTVREAHADATAEAR
jgi:universal stress protein A